MQQRIKEQAVAPSAGWRGLILPLLIVAAGTALFFFSAPLGGLVMLIGYSWLATLSLPFALAVYIVFSPFPFGLAIYHHQLNLSDLMAVVMAVRLVFSVRREGRGSLWSRFMGSPFWRPLVLLLALSVLSLATALSHSTTVIKILEYVEFFVVVVAVARHANLDEQQWKPVIAGLFGIGSLLAVYGFYQFLFQVGPASNVVDAHHIRADAIFGQPNAFGGFEALIFPIVVALLAYGPTWTRRWWAWATTILVALAVIESFSRGAWVASVFAVGVMGIVAWVAKGRQMINRRFVVPGILVPIAAFLLIDLLGKTNLSHSAFVLSNSTGGEITSTVGSIVNPSSNFDTRQRLHIWKEAVTALKTHPFLGVGLGGFHRYSFLHPQVGLKSAPTAHNLYLEWGADLGVLGVLSALWIEWSWLKNAVKGVVVRTRSLSAFEFAMGLGALGAIVSFVVHDWVDFLIDHGVVVPMLLALAVVWALRSFNDTRSSS